jgi:hypothetical protein
MCFKWAKRLPSGFKPKGQPDAVNIQPMVLSTQTWARETRPTSLETMLRCHRDNSSYVNTDNEQMIEVTDVQCLIHAVRTRLRCNYT